MENPYKKILIDLFESTNYYYHVSYRIDNLLKNESKRLMKENSEFHTSNAVVIADWTGPTENGWELPFHTNVFTTTNENNYIEEMEKIKSRENLFNFAQSFEVFQKFLKNCIITKNPGINRNDLKSNDVILKKLKVEGGITFEKFSSKNNNNFNFEKLFEMLVVLRNAITHSNSVVEKNKIIKKKTYTKKLFKVLMPNAEFNKNEIILNMNLNELRSNMKIINEFAFQIFKIFSIEEGLKYDWK